MDGWITIGTKLNTEKFDKQIKELENKIDSEEKKQELLNNKTKEYEADLAKANKQVENLGKNYNEAKQQAQELNRALKLTAPGSTENKKLTDEFTRQVGIVGQLSNQLEKAKSTQSNLQNKVAQTKLQYDNSNKAIDKMRGKIELFNLKRQQVEFKEIEKSTNRIKDGISNTIGQIGKMALAIFGIRSAYMALRRASSDLAQYNEQYATDLEYIRFALTNSIAPILEKIVQLAQTLMGYINSLTTTLFGKAIFASAKDFEKMKNSASSVAKSTKEIKNNLAGFDELNVLSRGQDSGASTGGITPTVDFAEIKIPDWLEDFKEQFISIFGEISDSVIGKLVPVFSEISKTASTLFKTLSTLLQSFWQGGVLPTIELIAKIWNGLWDSIETAWNTYGAIIFENIRIAIEKVAQVVLSLWENFLQPIWQNLIDAIDWLWDKHLKPLWDNILSFFAELINGVLELWNKTLAPLLTWVVNTFGPALAECINVISNVIATVLGVVTDVIDGIITILKGIVQFIVGVFTGDWDKAWQGISNIFKGIWDGIVGFVKGCINLIIDFINGMIAGIENALNWIVDKINSLEIVNPFTGDEIWSPNVPKFEFDRIPKLARGGIIARPTQAIIGEAGREAVMPLDSNTEWMDLLAEKISERISSGVNGQEITINFAGTMAQLVRSLKPEIEIENRRVGSKIITGGAY